MPISGFKASCFSSSYQGFLFSCGAGSWGEEAVGMEKPLAANPEVQQLPLAFQSVTAFRPDAKRVLGSNLSVRSPIACQSSAAPPGARYTRQDAADTPTDIHASRRLTSVRPPGLLLCSPWPYILPSKAATSKHLLVQHLGRCTCI